jgi:mono/diheme cytochrome c family protein
VRGSRARQGWEGGRLSPFLCGLCGAAIALLPVDGRALAASPEDDAPPYRVSDGRVDARTYEGFRRYNAVCSHCHGLDGAGGSFGPSLIAAPITATDFRSAVLAGRAQGTFVMNGYAADPNVAPYVDAIYAYLRARADGAIGRGRPLRAD